MKGQRRLGALGEPADALHRRGRILLLPTTNEGFHYQIAACLATGNDAVVQLPPGLDGELLHNLPASVATRLKHVQDWPKNGPFAGALIEGGREQIRAATAAIANLEGAIVPIQAATPEEIANNNHPYSMNWLLEETTTSINTTAAGGNASLMTIS